jgi:M6 family metalloprotease-like protein
VSVFTALVSWTLVTGPATHAAAGGGCVLPRTGVHHSEGADTWDSAYSRPRRTVDAVMIFLSFPDAQPLLSTGEVAADYLPAASQFFDRASYGRFRLRVHPSRGWVRMPSASTAYGIRRDWDGAYRSRYLHDAVAAADPVLDFASYDVVYLVADPDAPGVDADATKVVNLASPIEADGTAIRRLVTVFERHPPDRNVLAHETGHAFDLPDLYYRPPERSTANWDIRVGDWDLMGSQFGLAPEPLAWHKWRLGWLRPGQVQCLPRGGSNWYGIDPLESPGDGNKLVVVRTGPDEVLAIEARTRYGNDTAACTEGILLYRVRSDVRSGDGPIVVLDTHPRTSACPDTSVFPPLADAPLTVGESFTDTASRTRVIVGDAQGSSWTVKVSQG